MLKKVDQLGTGSILAIVVVVGIVIAIGYFLSTQFTITLNPDYIPKSNPDPIVHSATDYVPINTPVPSPTPKWKTYTSTKDGFTLEYPEHEITVKPFNIYNDKKEIISTRDEFSSSQGFIIRFERGTLAGKTFEEYVHDSAKRGFGLEGFEQVDQISIAGISGYSYFQAAYEAGIQQIYLPKPNKKSYLRITIINPPEKPPLQILDTLKFIQ